MSITPAKPCNQKSLGSVLWLDNETRRTSVSPAECLPPFWAALWSSCAGFGTAEFQLVLHAAGRPRVRSSGSRVCPNFKCRAGLNGSVNNSMKGREGNSAVAFRCVGAGTRLKLSQRFPPRTGEKKVCTVHWTDTTHRFKALWMPTPNKQRLSWCMFYFLLFSSLWFAPVGTSCYWSCDLCDGKKSVSLTVFHKMLN